MDIKYINEHWKELVAFKNGMIIQFQLDGEWIDWKNPHFPEETARVGRLRVKPIRRPVAWTQEDYIKINPVFFNRGDILYYPATVYSHGIAFQSYAEVTPWTRLAEKYKYYDGKQFHPCYNLVD